MSEVRDNPAASRFEMASGGAVASVEYERAGVAPAFATPGGTDQYPPVRRESVAWPPAP